MTVQEVIKILALLTLASNIGFVFCLVLFVVARFGIGKKLLNRLTVKLIRRAWPMSTLVNRSQLYSFIVALIATSGSLFLSEVAHFEPCVLCWYQRIFMYPLVILLGISLWKKQKDVWKYVLPMSIIGGFIAAYHYYLQLHPDAIAPCSSVGFSVSCSQNFFTYFGYITIPWMSLSAFVLITIGMFLLRSSKK